MLKEPHPEALPDQGICPPSQKKSVLSVVVPRRIGPIHLAVSYTSATAEARIGGDLYEAVSASSGVRVIIGDVQGKGLAAVETAAAVLGAFREAAYDEADLGGVAARLEAALGRQLSGEKFVTAVLAEFCDGDVVRLLNCGHPSPLILDGNNQCRRAEPDEAVPPLGLGDLATARPPVRGHVRSRRPDALVHRRDHRSP
jgi:serine phosphatase RsbU (regulator of sigma subunit)